MSLKYGTKGKQLGKEIKYFIDKKDKELVASVKNNNQEKTASIITSLGGFIFLLDNFETKLIREIRSLLKEFRHTNIDYFDHPGEILYDSWDSFDSISSSFSDIDSSGGDFGGGSGGDGGCSSCSGCSGCGGCGGCGG